MRELVVIDGMDVPKTTNAALAFLLLGSVWFLGTDDGGTSKLPTDRSCTRSNGELPRRNDGDV